MAKEIIQSIRNAGVDRMLQEKHAPAVTDHSAKSRILVYNNVVTTPILRLPVELHLEIVKRLDIRDKVNLASTSHYFRFIIPALTHSELLVAEESAWARSSQLYACKGCVNFRTWANFADSMRKGKWCRSGPLANSRLCLTCGVSSALYTPGVHLRVCNRAHVLCCTCQRLTDQVGHRGKCFACSPNMPRNRGPQYFEHDDWTYTTDHMREFSNWPEGEQLSRY